MYTPCSRFPRLALDLALFATLYVCSLTLFLSRLDDEAYTLSLIQSHGLRSDCSRGLHWIERESREQRLRLSGPDGGAPMDLLRPTCIAFIRIVLTSLHYHLIIISSSHERR